MRKRPEKDWRGKIPQEAFEPRPFQKEIFDRIKSETKIPPLMWGRSRVFGVDIGEKDGDKSVVVHSVKDKNGGVKIIYVDEYANFPDYKWYRNPIAWWKFRKLWKIIDRQVKRVKK